VLTCSALSKLGIADIWHLILDYQQFTVSNNFFPEHRAAQSKYWLTESIEANLKKRFLEDPSVSAAFKGIEHAVLDGKLSPFLAAEQLLNLFFKDIQPR
jgi:LAO/AO transport system kinase